jgi:hypothetical protein
MASDDHPHPLTQRAPIDAPQDAPLGGLLLRLLQGHCELQRVLRVWYIGYIYENGRAPEDIRWFWALHAPSKPGDMRISNQVATLEVAKVEFEASWVAWKAWAGLEETAGRAGGGPF